MDSLDELVAALRALPTIGPKTARRLALHLLQRDRQGALVLAESLQQALHNLKPCHQCRQLSLTPVCEICADDERLQSVVCVVETLDDLYRVEQTGVFDGRYFVLNGHLSPLDGVGPDELGIPQLVEQVAAGSIQEVILALNPQVEGEATAQYIHDQLRGLTVKVSQLAQGIPLGKELSRLDPATLSVALSGRTEHHG